MKSLFHQSNFNKTKIVQNERNLIKRRLNQQQQMSKQNNKTYEQASYSKYKQIMELQLQKALNSAQDQKAINEVIHHHIKYREEKAMIYSTSLSGKQYLQGNWKHYYLTNQEKYPKQQFNSQQKIQTENEIQPVLLPELSLFQMILSAATKRQHLIEYQIENQILKINKRTKISQKHQNEKQKLIQKQQNLKESKSSQKISQQDFFQFIKRQKQQKERRKKMLQKQKQRQKKQQQQKQQEEQKVRQNQLLQKQEEKRIKEKQLLQRRQKLKQTIKKHQSLYSEFQTKLFHSKEKQQAEKSNHLSKRFSIEEIRRIESEKKNLYKSFEKPKIDEHQKVYLQSVHTRRQQRQKKFLQMRKIQQMEKQKSRVRYHSSSFYNFERPQDQYERKKREQYERARQKRDRIAQYRNKVRSNHLPQLDEQKRNELMRLMEQLESNRKLKKKMLRNGEKVIEQIQVRDHKQVGLDYLKSVKQKVSKMRKNKRQVQQFREDISEQHSTTGNAENKRQSQRKKQPQKIDYLRQLRSKSVNKKNIQQESSFSQHISPSSRNNSSRQNSTSFSNKLHQSISKEKQEMSFDEKLRKIQHMSNRILQKTKQQEMLLKYGKFKTPQEILQKKQQIGKNYIELVNMKLKMIEDNSL